MASTIEIVNGISQAMMKSHDGALDEDGKPVEIGLRREQPTSIHDKRIMDGFGVNIMGNKLKLTYQSEIALKEVHGKKFEQNITDIMSDCISFLKKEYKSITKNSLGLKMIGEPIVRVEHMNRIRSWVLAHCIYEIEGINQETNEKEIDKSFEKWLSLGGNK